MPKKSFALEQIINKLREVEVLISKGQNAPSACGAIAVERSDPLLLASPSLRCAYGAVPHTRADLHGDIPRHSTGQQMRFMLTSKVQSPPIKASPSLVFGPLDQATTAWDSGIQPELRSN